MKKHLIYVFIFLFQLVNSPSHSQVIDSDDRWDFYIELSNKYSEDALGILQTHGLPNLESLYANDSTVQQLIVQYGTLVHESCHLHNIMHSPRGTESFFIDKDNFIQSKKGALFNSNLLNRFVSKKNQTETSRYSTYIGDEQPLTSQENGIYGLMDEFSAYYHGGKAMFDILDFVEETQLKRSNTEFLIHYLIGLEYDLLAYYEFKLFISWYLQYAEKSDPYLFTETFGNAKLRMAYTLLDDQYTDLLDSYTQRKKAFISSMKSIEPSLEVTSTGLKLRKGNVLQSFDGYSHQYDYYQQILDTPAHKVLARFRLGELELNQFGELVNP